MILRPIVLTTAAVSAATLAFAVHAQPPGPPQHPPMAHIKVMHEAMVRQHAEDLKAILRLRPDQEPALAAFLEAHARSPMMMMHGPDDEQAGPMPDPAMTTPQRLERMARRQAERTADMDKQRAALAKFYAALNPDQQKAFDALQRMVHGGPGGPAAHRIIMRGGPSMGHGGPH